MKSKEEILSDKLKVGDFYTINIIQPDRERIYHAMDSYAKQEAIAFAKWLKINAYHSKGDWYLTAAMSGDIYELDELYNLYLESKKQKV